MRTELVTTIAQMRRITACARLRARTIALVPTMGALHAGHGALIEQARKAADTVVVSIFVNPAQFDRTDDYEQYSRRLEEDLEFCDRRGAGVVFAPPVEEMYPGPRSTLIDVPDFTRHLCGANRPGHFQGVAIVVAKLFNIVQPDVACFGEKDAQQLAVIQQMVRDLDFPVEIVAAPTVREDDGLALSSRNQRLTPEQRRLAPMLFRALTDGQSMIARGERRSAAVVAAIRGLLETEPSIRIEYVEAVDARMQPVEHIPDDGRLAAAIWIGSTRLIDNVRCHVPKFA